MAIELEPIVGEWYMDLSQETTFTVTDVDEDEGVVELQDAQGNLRQIELSAWYELDLEPADEPEDWDDEGEDTDEEGYVGRGGKSWDDEDDEEDWDEEEEWSDIRPRGGRDEDPDD